MGKHFFIKLRRSDLVLTDCRRVITDNSYYKDNALVKIKKPRCPSGLFKKNYLFYKKDFLN